MNTLKQRTLPLNKSDIGSGPIVYWMYRDQRSADNWALLRAQHIALEVGQPLIVVVAIREDLRSHAGTFRWFKPMVEGLQEVSQDLAKKDISFECLIGDPLVTVPAYIERTNAGAVVCDFSPLKVPRDWQRELAKKSPIRWECVDTHNIVPCWVASPKQEFAARTFRPKIHSHITRFLVDFPVLKRHSVVASFQRSSQASSKAFCKPMCSIGNGFQQKEICHTMLSKSILQRVTVDTAVQPVSWFKPGQRAAYKALHYFLKNKLKNYDQDTNDPTVDGLSHLSPYFHFGHLAPAKAILDMNLFLRKYRTTHSSQNKNTLITGSQAFFEEAVVRRELSDNFCFYNHDYTSLAGAADWAKKSLKAHAGDPREYEYTYNTFKTAKTHDPAWNAAQQEMLQTGKMHGYMRMYWAKKILEWTKSPQEAIDIAITLNDTYELDGRDPNGYVGILWSIAGLHDRAWFERPVFGKIRYMNDNGLKKKFAIDRYIQRWIA